MTRSNVELRSHHAVAHLQPLSNVPKQCQRFQRYCLDKILKVKVTMGRLKVESRLHYDIAHLQYPTNVLTKYQISTPYSFQELARTRFNRSKQGQRSKQGHTMTLHTYSP